MIEADGKFDKCLHDLDRLFLRFDRGMLTFENAYYSAFALIHEGLCPLINGMTRRQDSASLIELTERRVNRSATRHTAWTNTRALNLLADLISVDLYREVREILPEQWKSMIESKIRRYSDADDECALREFIYLGLHASILSVDFVDSLAEKFPIRLDIEREEIGFPTWARQAQLHKQVETGCVSGAADLLTDIPSGRVRIAVLVSLTTTIATAHGLGDPTWWGVSGPSLLAADWRCYPASLLTVVSHCVTAGHLNHARVILDQFDPAISNEHIVNLKKSESRSHFSRSRDIARIDDLRNAEISYAAVTQLILGRKDAAYRWAQELFDANQNSWLNSAAGWILARNIIDPREKLVMLKRSPEGHFGPLDARRNLLAAEVYLELGEPQLAAYFLHETYQNLHRRSYIYRSWGMDYICLHAWDSLAVREDELDSAVSRLADLGYQVDFAETRVRPSFLATWHADLDDSRSITLVREDPIAHPR